MTPLEWKINQRMKNPYFLKRRRKSKKSRGHFLNPKPLICRTPRLNLRRNPVISVPTCGSHRVDELPFLAQRISTNGTSYIKERSLWSIFFFFSLPLSLPFSFFFFLVEKICSSPAQNCLFFFPFLFSFIFLSNLS